MRAPTLRSLAVAASIALAVGCAPPQQHKTIEMEAIGTHEPLDPQQAVPDPDGGDAPQTGSNDTTSDASADKPGDCSGSRFDNIYLALTNKSCEVDARSDKPVDLKDFLEVRIQVSTQQIVPGGRVDLTLTYRNKGTKPLPVTFTLDPSPRFDVEALDTRGRLVGIPKGKAPKQPPRVTKSTARITLSPGGTAKMKLGWNASNSRWATEQVGKGPVPDSGYPRVSTTPLAKGTYTLRLITPLTLVDENADRDLLSPRVIIEVSE